MNPREDQGPRSPRRLVEDHYTVARIDQAPPIDVGLITGDKSWMYRTRPENENQSDMRAKEMMDDRVASQGNGADITNGHKEESIAFAMDHSSMGVVLVAQSSRGICTLMLGEDRGGLYGELVDRYPSARLRQGERDLIVLTSEIASYLDAPRGSLHMPLDLRGTPFQLAVWRALLEIQPGRTASYTDVAYRIGRPAAVRAVAQACAANRIAVLIPCHRVLRNDGSLSGYRWGTERKRMLLERERMLNDGVGVTAPDLFDLRAS